VIGRTPAGDRRTPTSDILEVSLDIQKSEMASSSDDGGRFRRETRDSGRLVGYPENWKSKSDRNKIM